MPNPEIKQPPKMKELSRRLEGVSKTPEAEANHILRELDALDLEDLIAKRCEHVPLQYLLGHWQFRYLDLYLDTRVLIPRPETEITVGIALRCLERCLEQFDLSATKLKALDLGTGSGAIGLSLAHENLNMENPNVEVICTDISEQALEVAKINSQLLKDQLGGNKIQRAASGVVFRMGNWFEALEAEHQESFHLIVSNPPYIAASTLLDKEIEDHEPVQALKSGATGFEDIEHIISHAQDWLLDEGWLVVELSPDQAHKASKLAADLKYRNIQIHTDLTDRQRVLACQK